MTPAAAPSPSEWDEPPQPGEGVDAGAEAARGGLNVRSEMDEVEGAQK